MDGMNEELEYPKRSDRVAAVAKKQQKGIEKARLILEDVLRLGITPVDYEYLEEICFDIELLSDYCMPGILRDFRYLLSLLFRADDLEMRQELLAHINYLLVVLNQARRHLRRRIMGKNPDVTSHIEVCLGYSWKNIDFLDYKMYEDDAEILQVSFNSVEEEEKLIFIDKGYWFDLKTRKIHYTCRFRPIISTRYVKSNDTEFDVLQPEKIFIYPGKINCRIRWMKAQRRSVTSKDMAVLLESAETDYTDAVSRIKESFRDPLAERTPVFLIKLHKAFIHADHLVLEDERGGLLTVKDLSEDRTPTLELLQAILPAESVGYALLVEVNDDSQSVLFSVKPLSVITPDRIIRLLF
jgi:hypothetical protein